MTEIAWVRSLGCVSRSGTFQGKQRLKLSMRQVYQSEEVVDRLAHQWTDVPGGLGLSALCDCDNNGNSFMHSGTSPRLSLPSLSGSAMQLPTEQDSDSGSGVTHTGSEAGTG